MGGCKTCVYIVPILAILVYFLSQDSTIEITEQIIVESDFKTTYDWWADYENTKAVHPYMTEVEILDENKKEITVDGVKTTEIHQKIALVEHLPYMGRKELSLERFMYSLPQGKGYMAITTHASLVTASVNYTFTATDDNRRTIVSESAKILVPKLFFYFAQHQANTVHTILLEKSKQHIEGMKN